MKKVASSIKYSMSQDLIFEKYGFEEEDLTLLGSQKRENGTSWNSDPELKELSILMRLAIQEDKIKYKKL